MISQTTNHRADNLCALLSIHTKQHRAKPVSKTTSHPDMVKVNYIINEVKQQQLTSGESSKVAEGLEEGDVVRLEEELARQYTKCARQSKERARQLKCAVADTMERQIECIRRNALDGCLDELDKDA